LAPGRWRSTLLPATGEAGTWRRSATGSLGADGDTEINALTSAPGLGLVAAGDGPSATGNSAKEEQDARIWIRH
jgi:hypothetical protein